MSWDQVVAPRCWGGFTAGFQFPNRSLSYTPRASAHHSTHHQRTIATSLKRTREDAPPERAIRPSYNPAWPDLVPLPQNDNNKVMLVFDLNGTLTSLSEVRRSRGSGVRPGANCLRKLTKSNRFSMALWTSAVKKNLDKMQRQVEDVTRMKFDCALDRSHCVPAPPDTLRKKKHETVKPLETYFGVSPGLSKVILIDDNADKVKESESANLLLIPAWQEDKYDQVLDVLVEELLKLDCTKDVRPQIKAVQEVVWNHFQQAYPDRERLSDEKITEPCVDSRPGTPAIVANLSTQSATDEERRKETDEDRR